MIGALRESGRFCEARQSHYRNGRVKHHYNNRSASTGGVPIMRKLLLAAVAAASALTAAPAGSSGRDPMVALDGGALGEKLKRHRQSVQHQPEGIRFAMFGGSGFAYQSVGPRCDH